MSEARKNIRTRIDTIGVAVVLSLSAAGYVLGVQPVLDHEALVQEAEAQLVTQRQAAREAEGDLIEARKRVAVAERAVSENPLRLQPAQRLNARLAAIAATAARHDLRIDQLEPGRPVTTQHYITVPIRVVGRCGYASAARFLHDLHTAMPDLAIASIDLAGDPRRSDAQPQIALALTWHAAP